MSTGVGSIFSCPNCSVVMRVAIVGATLYETSGLAHRFYKSWNVDVLECPSCKHRICMTYNTRPTYMNAEPDDKEIIQTIRQRLFDGDNDIFFAHEYPFKYEKNESGRDVVRIEYAVKDIPVEGIRNLLLEYASTPDARVLFVAMIGFQDYPFDWSAYYGAPQPFNSRVDQRYALSTTTFEGVERVGMKLSEQAARSLFKDLVPEWLVYRL